MNNFIAPFFKSMLTKSMLAKVHWRMLDKKYSQLVIFVVFLCSFVFFITGCDIKQKISAKNKDAQVAQSLKQGKLDYYFSDINLFRYDAKGKLENNLQAKEVIHYRNSDLIHLSNIKFKIFSQPEINLTALFGNLNNRRQQIQVNKQVKLYFYDSQQQKNTLATDYLQINLQENLAKNNNFNKITNLNLNLTGTGIILDFANQKLELLNKVKGKYNAD